MTFRCLHFEKGLETFVPEWLLEEKHANPNFVSEKKMYFESMRME